MSKVICPYCNHASELVDSSVIYGRSYGLIYLCKPCDAYVGVHGGSKEPLGTLANWGTREARKKAHQAIDPVWQNGLLRRWQVYSALAAALGVPYIHIGESDIWTCEKIVKMAHLMWPMKSHLLTKTEDMLGEL